MNCPQAGQQKLPVNINDFETMRTEGYVYVAKTHHIYCWQHKQSFISSPAQAIRKISACNNYQMFASRPERAIRGNGEELIALGDIPSETVHSSP